MTPFYPVCAPDQRLGTATAYDRRGRKLGTMRLPGGAIEGFKPGEPKWVHFHPVDYERLIEFSRSVEVDSVFETLH